MPELPEVETTVNQLKRKILERKITDVWCDNPKMIKEATLGKVINANLQKLKKNITGRRVEDIKRRGKNILIELDNDETLLIHQKLTGHLLLGRWRMVNGQWQPITRGVLAEKINKYIHLILWLDDGRMLILSDLRKFAKVVYGKRRELLNLPEIKKLGPEPLDENFTFESFKETISKTRGEIKQVLMNQKVIAGIGNIYSNEILWQAKINPFKKTQRLTQEELKRIDRAMRQLLKKAIELRGESISDWRDTEGKEGGYDKIRKVYRRGGNPCPRCGAMIQKKKIGGRSTYFCPLCQPL